MMRWWLRVCLLFCCLPLLAWAQSEDSPDLTARSAVTLSLTFYYGDTKAADVTEILTFSADGTAYELSSHAAAVGLAKLLYGDSSSRSGGVVDEEYGLIMTLYQQTRGSRAPQQAERIGSTVRLQRGEEMRSETVEAPLFDHLSAVYRSYLLNTAVAGHIHYTNGWRLAEYEYINAGVEMVSTGMGEMEAVLLTRESARGERKIWLAKELNYLPVRLYIDDKGHEFTTVLENVVR